MTIRRLTLIHRTMSSIRNNPIQIDGSYQEGGGQILRNAITYAVLLHKSVTISNIRANRPRQPGVRPQHLCGMKLAVEIGNRVEGGSGGELVGAEVGAKTVSYVHHEGDGNDGDDVDNTSFIADTGTAGSIALLLQAALLPGLVRAMKSNSPMKIELRGGTNASGAPQVRE